MTTAAKTQQLIKRLFVPLSLCTQTFVLTLTHYRPSRSGALEVFHKRIALRVFTKFQWQHPQRSVIFILFYRLLQHFLEIFGNNQMFSTFMKFLTLLIASCNNSVNYIMCRSSRPEVFLGKGVLKICSKFIGEHPCRSVISIKLLCSVMYCFLIELIHFFLIPEAVLRKLSPRKIAPSPNSNANPKPNPDPDRGAIFRTPPEAQACVNIFPVPRRENQLTKKREK